MRIFTSASRSLCSVKRPSERAEWFDARSRRRTTTTRSRTPRSTTESDAGRTRTSREERGTRSSCGRCPERPATWRAPRVTRRWRQACCWCSTSRAAARLSASRCGWSRLVALPPPDRTTVHSSHVLLAGRGGESRTAAGRRREQGRRRAAGATQPHPSAAHFRAAGAGRRAGEWWMRMPHRSAHKGDAPHARPAQVTAAEALAFAQKHNCKYFEAVALRNEQARPGTNQAWARAMVAAALPRQARRLPTVCRRRRCPRPSRRSSQGSWPRSPTRPSRVCCSASGSRSASSWQTTSPLEPRFLTCPQRDAAESRHS